MAEISQIKLPNNTVLGLKDAKKTGIYTVIGTQTAATGAWTGVLDLPALYAGLTIMYYLPWAGSGNATLNLTLSDGTTTGAKNCYYSTGRLTTHYGKGCNIVMTYWPAGSIKVDGTATTDDRWIANANYADGNSTAYTVTNYYNSFKAGANKVFPYTIIMQCSDGRWESIVTSSSTGTSKARNTHGFRLGQIALMYANATYNENAAIGANTIWEHKSDLIDHRYSFNTANNSTSGTTAVKPVYLVGTLNATDGLFYLDTTWWTQTLPSTDDGKLYIYLGDAYDYYRMSFIVRHPIYWYKNGAIREFTQDSATVTGHTVAKDVPSNAVFTDNNTTYTIATGDSNGQIKVTPSSGSAYNVDVKGLGTAAYTASTSYASSSHTHSLIVTEGDNRNVATTPNDYTNKFVFKGIKTNSKIGSPSTDSYSYLFGGRGWSDSSGGNSFELAFNNTGIFYRSGATTTWGNWIRIDKDTTYTASTTSVGSASAGTAIAADDITAWTTNTPTAVTKKTVVTSATFNTVANGANTTAIPNISKKTVVTAASGATASVSQGVLTITNGSFTTGDSVTVGTPIDAVTSLTYGASGSATTGDSVSVTAGTAASLSYTARSIPNISVSSKTVVTGITAN